MRTVPIADSLAPGSHSIVLDGIEQRYHVAGQGPLCIAHPGGPGFDWIYLKMRDVEQHLTILYVEPIGTGGSGRLFEHPNEYGVECYGQRLERLVDTLDIRDFFMLGHSHGGFVIQQYAISHPDKVRGIIIYGSSAVMTAELLKDAGRNVAAFAQREAGSPEGAEVAQAWASFAHVGSDEDYTRELQRLLPVYFADYRRTGLAFEQGDTFDQFRSAFRATYLVGEGKLFDVRAALPKLRMPALIVVGEHDFMFGPKWAEILHAAIPGSQLVVLKLSGHMAHIEQPGAFAGVIGAFVLRNRHTPRPPSVCEAERATKPLN